MRQRKTGLFLFWNILFKLLGPGALALTLQNGNSGGFGNRRPVYHHHHKRPHSMGINGWIPFSPTMAPKQAPIIPQTPATPKYSHTVVHYYFIPEPPAPPPLPSPPKRPHFQRHSHKPQLSNRPPPPPPPPPPISIPYLKSKQEVTLVCDGKTNLIQDLGMLAIVSGAIGTLMGIFSASYLSVIGNTISVISAILSFIIGVPAAVITYLAASDRLSYTIANVLSMLSFANSFYSLWSVDFGNKDILLSQTANVVGIFSLALSIITAFPGLFDEMLIQLGNLGDLSFKRKLQRFVANYACDEEGEPTPTFYNYSENFFDYLRTL